MITRNPRHEKKSRLLTANLAFSYGLTIFPNAGFAGALIDRIVHHADILLRYSGIAIKKRRTARQDA